MRRTLGMMAGRLAAPLCVALVLASAMAVQAPTANDAVELPDTQEVLGVQGQVHYLPFDAQEFLTTLRGQNDTTSDIDSPVRLITSIVSALDGNEIAIDHWEDGYDADPLGSPGTTTQTLNLNEGQNTVLDNWVDVDDLGGLNGRGPNQPWYDGGDKLISSGAIVVTAGGWPSEATTLHAGAAVVRNVNDYGYEFVSPVGESFSYPSGQTALSSLWEYVGFIVVASEDGTTVDIDGTTVDLDEGDSHLVDGGVQVGDTITADKPIAVYLSTGDNESDYEGRLFTLLPTERWSDAYVTPVGSRSGGSNKSRVFLYNPSGSAITVVADPGVGSNTSITVPANGQANYLVPDDTGVAFDSPGNPFYALEATTTPESGSTDASKNFNWGFALTPVSALTPMVVIGYGPGSDDIAAPAGRDANDSGIYVASVANTTVYVDLDADPDTGGSTDGNGNQYDFSCALTAMSPVVLKDVGGASCQSISTYTRNGGSGDNDMTGARIYTTDGVSIAAAWGQVPGAATATQPAIDMGTTVLPFPTIDLDKASEIVGDDGDGEAVPGDVIRYTITVTNRGLSPVDDLQVNDQVPVNTTYVEDSTTAGGSPVADPGTGTPFPLDEGGLLVPPVLDVGETRTVTYDLLVDDPLPEGVTQILNQITLESDYGTYTDTNIQPVADPGSIGDRVWNDADGDGTQDGGETGLTGVTVQLLDDEGEVVTSTTTGADGAYSFGDVYPGDHTVRIVTSSLPAGMTGTYDLDGAGTANEASFSLAAEQHRTDVDFGYVAASISLTKTVYAGHDGGAGCAANTDDLVTGETTDPVTWCFEVTNTGPVGLVNVTVDDPDLDVDQSNMSLESGNPASLGAGQSVVWSYDGAIGGALVNDATATALLSVGGPSRTATDSAEVQVIGPGISLEKTAYRGHDGGASCAGADEVTIEQGGPLTYCFEVTNTGQTNLSAVTFSDPALGIAEGDHVHPLLIPLQTHTFHVEVEATEDLVNTATATGTSPAGVQPEATDSAEVDVVHPQIELQKSVYAGDDDGAGCTGDESLVRRPGDAVTWCFEITNTGDVDLSDVTLDDLPLGVDESDLEVASGSLSELAPDGSVSLYLVTPADADVANTATATGQPPVGPSVDDGDTASLDVIHPAVSIDKTVYAGHDDGVGCAGAEGITVRPGDDVTWCFEVTNEGDSPLTDVTVEDLDLDDSSLTLLSGSLATLNAGQSAVLYLEGTVDGDLANTASVTGTPEVGEDVTDEDTANTDEIHPAISIEKAVYGGHDDGDRCDTADDLHQDEDDTPVTWCFTVTNTGEGTLTDVRIDDLQLDVDQEDLTLLSGSLASLDEAKSVVLYLERTLTDDLENTAVATATPPVGEDVTDSSTATVEVLVPSVEIQKTVYAGHDGGTGCDDGVESVIARSGDPVTWCLLVRNTGDTDISTTVTDSPIGLRQPVDLGPGEHTTIHVEDVVDGDLPNTATVSGTSPGGHAVEDSDGASVDEVHPQITLDKTVYGGWDGGAGCASTTDEPYADEDGHRITWCFHIENVGDVPVTDVTIDDTDLTVDETGLALLVGSLDELAPGESVDLYLPSNIDGELVNDATATAVAPVGPDVTDDGQATVLVLVPGVTVDKTVYPGHDEGASCDEGTDSIPAQAGAEVTWCFLVHNTGETHLTVTVEDDLLPGYEGDVLDLDPDESQTLWFETTVDGDLDNVVTVTGETPDDKEVPADDGASVDEIHPAITVEKTVYSGHDGGAGCGVDGVDQLDAEEDEPVTWCFRIENTGDVGLTDLRLDDEDLDATEGDVTWLDDTDLASLPVDGVRWAYVDDVVEIPIVNDVTVTATAPDGEDVDDADSARVEVVGPEIGIAKKVVSAPQPNGDGSYTLDYRLRITNSGDRRLTHLQVTDDLRVTFADAAGFEVDDVTTTGLSLNPDYDGRTDVELLDGTDTLEIGETEDVTVTVTVTPGAYLGPYVNTARATGTSPIGVVVHDDSDSGSEADPGHSNPGEPGDTRGGTDDPVPVSFPPVDLTVSKTVDSMPEDGAREGTIRWGIVVGNDGPGDDPGPITVTDELDERLAFISAGGDGWSCSHEGHTVTCVWETPLAAGEQTSKIEVDTVVSVAGDTTFSNGAHVASTGAESRADNNDSAAEVAATIEAQVPSTLPRTGATIGGLVLLGLGLVLGGRLLQRRARGIPA